MMTITPDLISARALDGYKLDLVFADGKRGIFDCTPYLQYEFMEDVRDPLVFTTVSVDHGTVSWQSCGADLCPDDLYFNLIVGEK